MPDSSFPPVAVPTGLCRLFLYCPLRLSQADPITLWSFSIIKKLFLVELHLKPLPHIQFDFLSLHPRNTWISFSLFLINAYFIWKDHEFRKPFLCPVLTVLCNLLSVIIQVYSQYALKMPLFTVLANQSILCINLTV